MEEILIFLGIILVIILLILPIIIFGRISSINNSIQSLSQTISDLEYRINSFTSKVATKDDVKDILEAIDLNKPSSIHETTKSNNETSFTEKQEQALEQIAAEIRVSRETKIEPEIIAEQTALSVEETSPIVSPIEEEKVIETPPQAELPPVYIPTERPKTPEITLKRTTSPSIDIYAERERKKEAQLEIDEPEEKSALEKFLTENLFSKIGIITLVLGIGFFVKYAIDKDWINEVGRVGIGILTGAIIVGIAHKLRKNYEVFSSILVGGGIATFYITITLAFREYEIFSQPVAFGLLIFVTIFSVILSLYYDRKELAIFSLLGGFGAPLMVSTGDGNYIVLFSYILILNTGMLLVSFKKNWRIIGIIAYSLTLIFFWTWTLRSFENQYLHMSIFTALIFIQFYLLALFDHAKTNNKVTAYQIILILVNNMSTFGAYLYIFDSFDQNTKGIISISLAIANAIVLFILFRKSSIDRTLVYLLVAIVMGFVSITIPIALNGHFITIFWAVEIVILLLLWQKSKIQVFRIGFIVIAAVTLISYLMDLNFDYNMGRYEGHYMSPILNGIFATGVVVIASFVISTFLLKREDSESEIELWGMEICSVGSIKRLFNFIIIVATFFVPYLELNYQIEMNFETTTDSFRYLALGTYAAIYASILCTVLWKLKTNQAYTFVLFLAFIVLHTLLYSVLVSDLRSDIFEYGEYSPKYFLIHFASLPAIFFIVFYLIKKIKVQSVVNFKTAGWILALSCIAILSVEMDNIIVLAAGNAENYYNVLFDTHTYGYAILWGTLGMLLMIWGLNRKEVLLRRISLFVFTTTILKFYIYDVWQMTEIGKIVSFVALGLILLLVAFLQQRIKVLIKSDEEVNELEENKPV